MSEVVHPLLIDGLLARHGWTRQESGQRVALWVHTTTVGEV